MDFRELQEKHAPWVERNFPNAEKWEPLVGLVEETGELSHAFLKCHQCIRVNENHHEKMVDAVGDIIIYLAHFCTMNNIDMQSAVEDAWAEVSKRDWVNHKGNGKDINPEHLTEVGRGL